MLKISKIKVTEIAKITGQSVSSVSQHLKELNLHNDFLVKSKNDKKIIGLHPNAAEKYLQKFGILNFSGPSIILSANICGGVGKTTSTLSLGIALKRICNNKNPIVFVDGDSQGSLTSIFYEEPALENEPILIDFLDGKVPIKKILANVYENIWIVKSNLNQALLDKVVTKPKDVKEKMLSFYQETFNYLGENTKIFQDHPPQLSSLFASSICAFHQIKSNVLTAIIVPIRGDRFALQGAGHIIKEVNEIKETFNFKKTLKIYCFFSSLDGRISATKETLKIAKTRQDIEERLSVCAIRYCGKVPKSITRCNSIFSETKKSKATEDYQELLCEIFNLKGNING